MEFILTDRDTNLNL